MGRWPGNWQYLCQHKRVRASLDLVFSSALTFFSLPLQSSHLHSGNFVFSHRIDFLEEIGVIKEDLPLRAGVEFTHLLRTFSLLLDTIFISFRFSI